MTQPNRPMLRRAASYLCAYATSHQVSNLENPNSTNIALHLHGGEVSPNDDGGYSIETLALATVVVTPALAREIIASLSAAVEQAEGAGAPVPASPAPSAPPPPQEHGRVRAKAKA